VIFTHDEYGFDSIEYFWTPEELAQQEYHEAETVARVDWAAELASFGCTDNEIHEIMGLNEEDSDNE